MINKTPNKNLSIAIHASPQKWILVLLPHFVSFIVVFSLVQVSILLSLVLILLIVFSTYYFLRLHLFFNASRSVKTIYQDSRNNWFLISATNDEIKVSLLPESFSSNFLIIINYIDSNQDKYVVVITPDSVPSELFRQLKVNLKTQ